MSCNCSSSCNCDSGVELIGVTNGVSAPTNTNVVVNGDNTITYTYSDGSTITTSAITVNTPSALSYVYYHSESTDNFSLAADSLAANGDKLRVLYRGTVPNGDSVDLIFDGNSLFSYPNVDQGITLDFKLDLEIVRTSSSNLEYTGTLITFYDIFQITSSSYSYSGLNTIIIDSFRNVTNDTYDFTTALTLAGRESTVTLSLLNVELITNN